MAYKEIIGGYRGWRLRILEEFIIIMAFTQLLYVLFLHPGLFTSKYGPGYRDTEYGTRGAGMDPIHKGSGVTDSLALGVRIWNKFE